MVYKFMKIMENARSSELRYFSNRADKNLLRNTGLCGVILGEAMSLPARMVSWRGAKIDLLLSDTLFMSLSLVELER